eukprot:jgi/Mesen1/1976/ME000147S01064
MEASPSTDTAAVAAAPVGATPATGDVSLETPAAATIDAATQSAATSTGGSAPAAPALPETLIQLSDEQAAKILRQVHVQEEMLMSSWGWKVEATEGLGSSQVEFYFSDSNLPRDKFMLEKMEGDGMVSLALLCSFARMRDHLGVKRPGDAMPPGTLGAVAAVLRKSQTLRLSDDAGVTAGMVPLPRHFGAAGTQVGRVTKLGEVSEVQAAMDRRTLHAQPFPYNASLEDISAFFADFGEFVDFSAGQVAGFVRFEHAHEAERALQLAKAMDPKCVKVGADGTTYAFLRLLDGEEEQEYWTKLREGQDRRHEKFGGGFRGGRGGGQRGGRKGGRGGGRGGRDNGYGGGGGGRGHKRFRAGEN